MRLKYRLKFRITICRFTPAHKLQIISPYHSLLRKDSLQGSLLFYFFPDFFYQLRISGDDGNIAILAKMADGSSSFLYY